MYLTRIIYCSRKSQDVRPDDLKQILEAAHAHNTRQGVTGMLCFNRKYFLQVLEGGRTAVNETYNRIVRDGRHDDVILIEYSRIDKRSFSSRAMGYVSEAGLSESLLMRYGGRGEFNPLDMTPQGAVGLLLELKEIVNLAQPFRHDRKHVSHNEESLQH